MTFPEAVQHLAVEAGVELPKSERFKNYLSRRHKKREAELEKLSFCKELFTKAYSRNLLLLFHIIR